jgi:signal transduction histidine kinase
MRLEDLRALSIFAGLTDPQLAELLEAGEEHQFVPDEVLFHEGRPADSWWVLLEGTVSLVRQVGKEETALGAMTQPGQWAGGFRAWDEHGVYFATGRATSSGRAFALSATVLRDRADAWFPFGVHFIKGLVDTVRRIEAGARQREALVALGTLAAGLAHEINNPASSATRSVDALEGTSESLMSSLGRLAQEQITADQFVALDDLRREAAPRPATLDALTVADNEEILSDWLTAHGVDEPWVIAPALAAAGMDVVWCEKVSTVLGEGPLGPALEWVASSVSMTALLAEVKDATHRVSDLVAAVREYSQLDRASVQTINVTEGLESTLVMFGHKLRRGITVERDFDPELPRIEAIPGELNQVWTNLIANALDAMGGTGTLRLTTRVDDLGWVVVEIADTGPGMPEHLQARAFEPFFTTKAVGVGTGLGLDISRRIIVDRHSGEITIDSVPGRTVLAVRLPTGRSKRSS